MAHQDKIELLIDEALSRQAESDQHSLWDCLALVGLTSVNKGHYGAYLYKSALEKMPAESRPLLWRRYVDALTEMLIIVGMPKTLNALYPMIPLVNMADLTHVKKSDWEADNSARAWEYARLTHGDGWDDSFKAASIYAPDVAHITMNISMRNLLSDYSVHDGPATMALSTVEIEMICPKSSNLQRRLLIPLETLSPLTFRLWKRCWRDCRNAREWPEQGEYGLLHYVASVVGNYLRGVALGASEWQRTIQNCFINASDSW